MLDIFGGIESFLQFHAVESHVANAAYLKHATTFESRCADDEALNLAQSILGDKKLRELASLGKAERDKSIALLRRAGITIKQIERLTGVGRGIVNRVKWRE